MATKAPKPSIRERAAERICPNCAAEIPKHVGKGKQSVFCKPACKVAHQNRRVAEGTVLSALVKAWRIDRGSGEIAQEAFSQICAIADQFNADDAAAGRPRADLYAAKLLANGSKYLDRQAR